MIYSVKKQRGLTFLSITFILILLAFFVLLALKIGPIYMNHSKVVNALSAVENMVDVESMSKRQIIMSLYKRFNMNYVDHITTDDVRITTGNQYVKVEIQYEVVEKIAGNLSVLVEFDESFEVGASK